MSKKTFKIIITYVLAFFTALAVIGGAGLILINRYQAEQTEKNSAKTAEEDSSFIPGELDSMTVLGVYDASQRPSGVCFVLFRLSAEQQKLYVTPLHSDLETGGSSLYDVYTAGGITAARDVLEQVLKIGIDKYMLITSQSFSIFSDSCGNISYNVPYNLIYTSADPDENTIIREGSLILDTKNLRRVLTFPEYTDGEEERMLILGNLTVELINNGCRSTFRSNREDVYNSLVAAGAATDISIYDMQDISPATDYILERSKSPASLLLPSGGYNEEGRYEPEPSFLEALPRWYGIKE
ncbi:MAG: hypothetical protein J6F31_03290 [Oscillospiraceae bacterium]|nr:hypothetical protein [Oscillospiraceae bacterium]